MPVYIVQTAATGGNRAAIYLGSGVDSYLLAADAAALDVGAEDFTVAAWIRLPGGVAFGQIWNVFNKDFATTGFGLGVINVGAGDQFLVSIRNLGTFVVATGVTATPGQWYLLVGWHDQTSGQIGIAVDNGTATTTARATAPSAGTAPLLIGDNFYTGDIQRVGFWRGRVLDATARATLYNSGAGYRYADLPAGLGTSLQHWWDLDEATSYRRNALVPAQYLLSRSTAIIGTTTGNGADYAPPTITRNLVCTGDSLTFGFPGQDWEAYPTQTVAQLTASWAVINNGVNGDSVQALTARAAATDALQAAGKTNILVVWIGANNFLGTAETPATVFGLIKAYCQARQAAGWTVAVCTMTGSAFVPTPGTYEAYRQTLNTSIRGDTSFYTALADLGASGNGIGDLADCSDLAIYTDGIHMTTAGYSIAAAIVATAIGGL
jgi:lysophospholipase L1-like esterase